MIRYTFERKTHTDDGSTAWESDSVTVASVDEIQEFVYLQWLHFRELRNVRRVGAAHNERFCVCKTHMQRVSSCVICNPVESEAA